MTTKVSSSRKEPLSSEPLPEPGQSLRGEILDRFLTPILLWPFAALLVATIAVVEWAHWLGAASRPVPMTLAAMMLAAFATWRWRRAVREVEPWKFGLRGERRIGQLLQAELIPLGYVVIHDICFEKWNVDHAVIGPGGVFAIEVKTRTKPARGGGRIAYDGQTVLVNGYKPDRDPIAQARAGAADIRRVLKSTTGQLVPVRPVVLFPEWYVEKQPRGVETWVLNEKVFVSFVEHEAASLDPAEVRLLNGT